MMYEIKVKIKDEDQTNVKKFLVYEEGAPIILSRENIRLKEMVDEAIAAFKGQPENINIKIEFEW